MDSRSRKLLLYAYGGLAGVMTLGAVGAVIATTQVSDLSFSDRLAEIGDWVGGGTLLLAAFAAAVALLAYAFSTGLPDLKFQITFPGGSPNQAIFKASRGEVASQVVVTGEHAQPVGRITLYNKSVYSAQNPAVVIRLNNMAIDHAQFARTDGWIVIEETSHMKPNIKALQWDGGSDYAIHGDQSRQLPEVNFQGLLYFRGSADPSITFELFAERYRRPPVTITVNFIIDRVVQIRRTRSSLPHGPWL